MSFSAAAFDAMITLKADNSGTPASGDTVDFYALLSCGDPDGSGGDEFRTMTATGSSWPGWTPTPTIPPSRL
jgi:hypothetical protein